MPVTMLRAGDDRGGTLVCVHSVDGNANTYQALADALDWSGSVIGIDVPEPSVDGYQVSELAVRYTDELNLRVPISLLGWSLGGVIAAETSRVIVARGGEVAFLGLLDSRAPQPEMRTRPTDRDSLARLFLHATALRRERTPVAPPSSLDASHLLASLRELGADDDLADEAELERRLAIFIGLIRALFRHEQLPVPIQLHLFESADAHPSHPKPPTLGWDDLAPSIEREVVAGTHFTLMAASRIEALARTISRCLPR